MYTVVKNTRIRNIEMACFHLMSFCRLLVVSLLVLSLNHAGFGNCQEVSERRALVPAMFIFGDSLIDNGNNNNLPSFAKANYFPYGIDFQGGATGRFSNGYTMVDTIGTSNFHLLFKIASMKHVLLPVILICFAFLLLPFLKHGRKLLCKPGL